MQRALDEVKRRRKYQAAYNKKHNITPTTIDKPRREKIIEYDSSERGVWVFGSKEKVFDSLPHLEIDAMTPMEKKLLSEKFVQRDVLLHRILILNLRQKLGTRSKKLMYNFSTTGNPAGFWHARLHQNQRSQAA